jgi:hypothetical protein
VSKFIYFGMTLTNQNWIHSEINSKVNSGNACYHAVQNRLSFRLLSAKTWLKYTKLSHYTSWRRLGERRYSSYSFTTSVLDGVSGQLHVPAAL